MASPPSGRLTITPSPTTPDSRVLRSPLTDDAIWRRLRDAGFDEESIKRRDKAALIAYIAKLEAELHDHQHQMGMLLLERKDWVSKYEEIKASAESTEYMYKREQAAHSSSLAEAKKREDNLKKALGIEKECVTNIEKALHEMRAECAETKVSADSKLAEARNMVEDAQKKFTEAEAKLHAAESLEAESNRYHRMAERKLNEVEAREDDLRRRILSFKSECEAKDKEMALERQSLSERHKSLQQLQDQQLDGQASLNKRENYIFSRMQELTRLEKELEASKSAIEKELSSLNEDRGRLKLDEVSLSAREEAVIRREFELNKKEEDLLIQQQKLASKESDGMKRVMANHEAALRARQSDFEAELEMKRKSVENELERKRRACELMEVDLKQKQDLNLEKEHDLEVQLRALEEKEKDLTERTSLLEEREQKLIDTEREVEFKRSLLEKEREEINSLKLDLQKSVSLLEDRKKEVDHAEEEIVTIKTDTNDLLVLEMRLKEEIDIIGAQKVDLEIQAEELKTEKAKFEAEWESIDEKREELQKEAERVAEEREAISKFLKDERDCLKLERDAMWEQYKRDVESLSRDREAFMKEIEHERTEWFSKIQKERGDFLLDIEMQKRELEYCITKRREEIEGYLREREKAFEEEKKKELQHVASLRETLALETEQVNREMEKLEAERREINLDRERRDKEWAELNNSINELKVQREKLEKLRELLHADRKDILAHNEELRKLEDLKIPPDYRILPDSQETDLQSSRQNSVTKRFFKQPTAFENGKLDGNGIAQSPEKGSDVASPVVSAPFTWLKRCADSLLERAQSNKKRKHGRDVTATPSGDITPPRSLEDEPGLNEAVGGTEETTVYIDKIITIREVTSVEVGSVLEDNQYQQESISKEIEEKIDDHSKSRSNEDGKFESAIGTRTRSKQKI